MKLISDTYRPLINKTCEGASTLFAIACFIVVSAEPKDLIIFARKYGMTIVIAFIVSWFFHR